jgi:ABC-type uncharacterized transport system involved in gliding motility auxiliary subunit
MITRSPKGRAYASTAAVTVAFTAAMIVLVNVVGVRVFGRVDLTEDRLYTLSPASKRIVSGLDDYLTVKAFISRELPAELAPLGQYLRELLAEYRIASRGKLRYELYDPADSPDLEHQAEECEVRRMAVESRSKTKAEVGRYFLGLCLWYGGKSRAFSDVRERKGLEYQITALIKQMTQPPRKVAFTAGHGERDLGDSYSFARFGLRQEYNIATLNPSRNPIPDDVDLLVVAGPRQPFDEQGRREIDAFLMKGKGALFLLDGAEPEGAAIDTGLDPLLEGYGFKVGRDVLFDSHNVPGPVGPQDHELLSNSPGLVAVAPDPRSRDGGLPIVNRLTTIVFPFPSPVALAGPLAGGAPDGTLWTIASTSADSWRRNGDKGPFTIGYAYQGVLSSAFEDVAGMRPRSRKPVRLVVMGDSDFVEDRYMRYLRELPVYAAGAQLLFNAVSWTLEDETLIPLRSGVQRARPIDAEAIERSGAIRWGNAFGVPAAFCALGLLRWRVRRTSRQRQTPQGKGGDRTS